MAQIYDINESPTFNVKFSSVVGEDLSNGFNEYGVKEHDDGSIDVIFAAMEPGLRKDFRITKEFLQYIADNFNGPIPIQLDHSEEQLRNVGKITDARFRGGFLRLLGHIPNTGSSIRDDVIADFTHDPPAITDGSAGFSEQFEIRENEAGEIEFVKAELVEFSLTPFPAGYENGGLSPRFTEAAKEAGVFNVEGTQNNSGTARIKGQCMAQFHDI